jgi:hypothetical protein
MLMPNLLEVGLRSGSVDCGEASTVLGVRKVALKVAGVDQYRFDEDEPPSRSSVPVELTPEVTPAPVGPLGASVPNCVVVVLVLAVEDYDILLELDQIDLGVKQSSCPFRLSPVLAAGVTEVPLMGLGIDRATIPDSEVDHEESEGEGDPLDHLALKKVVSIVLPGSQRLFDAVPAR